MAAHAPVAPHSQAEPAGQDSLGRPARSMQTHDRTGASTGAARPDATPTCERTSSLVQRWGCTCCDLGVRELLGVDPLAVWGPGRMQLRLTPSQHGPDGHAGWRWCCCWPGVGRRPSLTTMSSASPPGAGRRPLAGKPSIPDGAETKVVSVTALPGGNRVVLGLPRSVRRSPGDGAPVAGRLVLPPRGCAASKVPSPGHSLQQRHSTLTARWAFGASHSSPTALAASSARPGDSTLEVNRPSTRWQWACRSTPTCYEATRAGGAGDGATDADAR